jgi:hypothetical protein
MEVIVMFEAKQSGNPRGRSKGSYGGRIQALAVLDRLMAQKKRQSALMQALGQEFDRDLHTAASSVGA